MEQSERKIAKAGVNRQILVRPEAESEVQQAFNWYEKQSEGLGFEFLRAIEACLSGVKRNPFAYTIIKNPNVRRAIIRRFPYALFYLVDDEAIVVIAVFNVKRRPIDWQQRV
ncbi:type II toxin-antitoxin system RelE/ParE family toxin [soil metagenome]